MNAADVPKHQNGQLSIEAFHVPFGGTLDPDNRWVLFSSLMPWEELEETYAPQFSPTTGAPAKSVRLAFGALFIKQRLGLSDEETVEQIRENAYMQFFLGFAGYSSKAPFDPSTMVHFRKRFSEEDLKRINELIAERGKAIAIEAMSSLQDDDDSDEPGAHAGTQISLEDLVKPADWPGVRPPIPPSATSSARWTWRLSSLRSAIGRLPSSEEQQRQERTAHGGDGCVGPNPGMGTVSCQQLPDLTQRPGWCGEALPAV